MSTMLLWPKNFSDTRSRRALPALLASERIECAVDGGKIYMSHHRMVFLDVFSVGCAGAVCNSYFLLGSSKQTINSPRIRDAAKDTLPSGSTHRAAAHIMQQCPLLSMSFPSSQQNTAHRPTPYPFAP